MPDGTVREVQTPIGSIINGAAVEVGFDPDRTEVKQVEMHGERLLLTLVEQPEAGDDQ